MITDQNPAQIRQQITELNKQISKIEEDKSVLIKKLRIMTKPWNSLFDEKNMRVRTQHLLIL